MQWQRREPVECKGSIAPGTTCVGSPLQIERAIVNDVAERPHSRRQSVRAGRIMDAYVFVSKELADPHLETLKVAAGRLVERHALTGWWDYRGAEIVFGFRGDKAIEGANSFIVQCAGRNIPFRREYP
jgi:hypothetical protein